MKEIRETGGEQVQKQLSPRRKMADAVITVEASFVMAVVLFVCGALISQGFYVHERNTGMLILWMRWSRPRQEERIQTQWR